LSGGVAEGRDDERRSGDVTRAKVGVTVAKANRDGRSAAVGSNCRPQALADGRTFRAGRPLMSAGIRRQRIFEISTGYPSSGGVSRHT
jgi:hypothetical protein